MAREAKKRRIGKKKIAPTAGDVARVSAASSGRSRREASNNAPTDRKSMAAAKFELVRRLGNSETLTLRVGGQARAFTIDQLSAGIDFDYDDASAD